LLCNRKNDARRRILTVSRYLVARAPRPRPCPAPCSPAPPPHRVVSFSALPFPSPSSPWKTVIAQNASERAERPWTEKKTRAPHIGPHVGRRQHVPPLLSLLRLGSILPPNLLLKLPLGLLLPLRLLHRRHPCLLPPLGTPILVERPRVRPRHRPLPIILTIRHLLNDMPQLGLQRLRLLLPLQALLLSLCLEPRLLEQRNALLRGQGRVRRILLRVQRKRPAVWRRRRHE